jgi:hypothetical protein
LALVPIACASTPPGKSSQTDEAPPIDREWSDGVCAWKATVVDFDARELGTSGAQLFARARGVWRGTLAWASPPPGVMSRLPAAGTTAFRLRIANPGRTWASIGRNVGTTDIGCGYSLNLEVDLHLATEDGALDERWRAAIHGSQNRHDMDGIDVTAMVNLENPRFQGRAAAKPSGTGRPLRFLELELTFRAELRGGMRASVEEDVKHAMALHSFPVARLTASRRN